MSIAANSSLIYIGIDAGTSGIRACAIDETAQILCERGRPLPPPLHDNLRLNQAPAEWASVMFAVITDLKAHIDLEQVRAMAIDGTSGTVLLTDASGHPLTDALMYNDTSSLQQVNKLKTVCPDIPITHSLAAGLPKILQLAEQVNSGAVGHIMHQADWLSFLFTRQAGHSDVNNCLKTGYDALNRQWPACMAQLAPVDRWLPQVHISGDDIARIDTGIARQYGLSTSTMIRAGTTDSTAAVIATGAHQIGDAVTSLGSTLVMKVISDRPIFDHTSGVYSQPLGSLWLVGGGSNSGGAVLRRFFTDEQMQALSSDLEPQVDTGLQYYPLNNTGERFPINDPDLAPRLEPRPADDGIFFQGLLEGMAQIEYNAYRRLQELGTPYPTRVFSVGGGAINAKWTQIRQRYLQTHMQAFQDRSAAYGSALIARQQDNGNQGV